MAGIEFMSRKSLLGVSCGRFGAVISMLAAVAIALFLVSCVGGPDKKAEAPIPVKEEVKVQAPPPVAASQGVEQKLLAPPTPVMPPLPGERLEKDILADADRRAELLKTSIQKDIAAVVPGPYPEPKREKAQVAAKEPPAPPKAKPPVEEAAVKAPPVAVAALPARAAEPAKPSAVESKDAPAPQPVEKARPPEPAPAPAPAPRPAPVISFQQGVVPELSLVRKFTVAEGLPSNLVSALFIDETDAWVGTAGGGVARFIFAEGNWIVTTTTNGLASDFVTDITKYKGKVYVGTKQGISVWDGFDWTIITEKEQVQLHSVHFATKDGELWVAARNMRGGILSFDGTKWTDKSNIRTGIIFNNVSDLTFDGPNIWLGTTSRGVYVQKGKEWSLYSVAEGIASNFIYTMAVKGGKCYLGGCCGLSYFDGEKWVVYDIPEGLAHSTVNSIAWDVNDVVWLGTKNGLSAFDGSQFRNFYVEDGLIPDNQVTALFLSGDELWVGTVGGLAQIKKVN